MAEHTPGYVAALAGQLTERHPDLIAAENDLALLRGRIAIVTTFIHDPAYDTTARRALAQALQLPAPAAPEWRRKRSPASARAAFRLAEQPRGAPTRYAATADPPCAPTTASSATTST